MSESQKNLFGTDAYGGTLARTSDPATSHEASKDIAEKLPGLQQFAVDCVRRHPGLTASELASKEGIADPRTINRRLGECAAKNLIRVGESRKRSVTGKSAQTWWPAENS